ncbi:hypothetical protein FOZ63_006189, partial [Perkinsus olseni]
NVVGFVESKEEPLLPHCVWSALPEKERRTTTLIYISYVMVREDWQNRKVGSAMFPKALEDIHSRWPSASGVYLIVDATNNPAVKLYKKFNFTDVGESGDKRCFLYKYPTSS